MKIYILVYSMLFLMCNCKGGIFGVESNEENVNKKELNITTRVQITNEELRGKIEKAKDTNELLEAIYSVGKSVKIEGNIPAEEILINLKRETGEWQMLIILKDGKYAVQKIKQIAIIENTVIIKK